MKMVKSSTIYFFALLLLVMAVVFGVWTAIALAVSDPAYLEDSIKYPSLYPASEAPKQYNFLAGSLVFGVFFFFSAVCFGITSVIEHIAQAAIAAPANQEQL